MGKKIHKLILIFLFFYLALFPFGQMPRLILNFLGVSLPLHFTDLVIFSFTAYILKKGNWRQYLAKNKSLSAFVIVAAFAWAVNAAILGRESLTGFIYLARLVSYFLFFIML